MALKVFFGALIVCFLSFLFRSATHDSMKGHFDHAMASNLAKNLGGDFSHADRDAIADIIRSRS